MKAIKRVCAIMIVTSLAFVSAGLNGASDPDLPGSISIEEVKSLGPTVPGEA